ncbi:MAG: hypothetical protein ACRDJO_04350 [Actinomycetota bacterium]
MKRALWPPTYDETYRRPDGNACDPVVEFMDRDVRAGPIPRTLESQSHWACNLSDLYRQEWDRGPVDLGSAVAPHRPLRHPVVCAAARRRKPGPRASVEIVRAGSLELAEFKSFHRAMAVGGPVGRSRR